MNSANQNWYFQSEFFSACPVYKPKIIHFLYNDFIDVTQVGSFPYGREIGQEDRCILDQLLYRI